MMNTLEYIKRQITYATSGWDGILKDLTDDQCNWPPPGTCNSIAATLLHVYGVEDFLIQSKLKHQSTLWEIEGWADKIGVSAIPDKYNQWTEMKRSTLPITALLAYGLRTRSATNRYLSTLTPEELEREVELLGGTRSVAETLSFLVIHLTRHSGEIAVLKGLQGLKGQTA